MVEPVVRNHIVILAVSAKPRCGEANKNSDKIKNINEEMEQKGELER